MNQTYVIPQMDFNNNVNRIKKYQLKTKLNKLRERTQLLLQNHNWKKYFNSPSATGMATSASNGSGSTTTASSLAEEEISMNFFRNNQQIDAVEQKSILLVNSKSSSKLNSFLQENLRTTTAVVSKSKEEKMLLTPFENYFLSNSNTQLNLLNETPILRDNQQKSEMDFYETPCSNSKKNQNKCESFYYIETNNNLATPRSVRVLKKQQSLTFIGDLVSTSTPTRNNEEKITSTPNASTHNALKFHPSRTIRNKKLQRKLFSVETNNELKIQDIQSLFKEHKHLLKLEFATSCKKQQTHRHRRHHHHHHHYHHQQQQQQNQNACACHYKQDQHYELKRLAHSSPKVQQNKRMKIKSSSIEMRLKDLLYTPNKLKHLIKKQQQLELKKLQDYYRYKSELTTPTSTPAKAGALCTSSKIYFL